MQSLLKRVWLAFCKPRHNGSYFRASSRQAIKRIHVQRLGLKRPQQVHCDNRPSLGIKKRPRADASHPNDRIRKSPDASVNVKSLILRRARSAAATSAEPTAPASPSFGWEPRRFHRTTSASGDQSLRTALTSASENDTPPYRYTGRVRKSVHAAIVRERCII